MVALFVQLTCSQVKYLEHEDWHQKDTSSNVFLIDYGFNHYRCEELFIVLKITRVCAQLFLRLLPL